jgi:hypothetical protein
MEGNNLDELAFKILHTNNFELFLTEEKNEKETDFL